MVYESKRSGFVIPAKNWHDEHLFKIASNGSRYAFVTEQGKAILESITPTNIAFAEAGEIVE